MKLRLYRYYYDPTVSWDCETEGGPYVGVKIYKRNVLTRKSRLVRIKVKKAADISALLEEVRSLVTRLNNL